MSLSYVGARDALVTFLNTAWSAAYPTIPAFYENLDTLDMDRVGNSFIRVEVSFEDAAQMSLEAVPLTRAFGHLQITVMSKMGTGTRAGLVYADFLVNLFKYQNLSGVVVGAPSLGHRESHDGWHYQEVLIPFRFTS